MLSKISSKISSLYDKQIDARGFAIFRIVYFINLFLELLRVYNFRHLIFDKVPFVDENEIAVGLGLILWLAIIVMLCFGMFTRINTILNYVLSVVFFGMSGYFAYHMYYVYTTMAFLFIFLPISRAISIDRLFEKLKYSSSRYRYEPPNTVSAFFYLLPLFICNALIYSDSILYKFVSTYWMSGLGMWLPSSLPMITHVDTSVFLNLKWLMKFIGYLTVAFEFIYLFLFWNKKWRVPLLIIGVGLHLGILLEFPIPYFAIGVVGLYILMVPVSFWKSIELNRKNKKTLFFYYDAECPLCNRTVIVLSHFDIFKRLEFVSVQSSFGKVAALKSFSEADLLNDIHSVDNAGNVRKGYETYRSAFSSMVYLWPLSLLLYLPGISHLGKAVYRYIAVNRTNERCTDETCGYEPPIIPKQDSDVKLLHNLTKRELKLFFFKSLLVLLVLVQFTISLNSLLFKKIREKSFLKETILNKELTAFSFFVRDVARPTLGLANHPVFMDFHFKHYNHIVAVVYRDGDKVEFLPMINENGQPGSYLEDATFVNWTFKVVSAQVEASKLSEGISRYTAFWAGQRGLQLNNLKFEIMVKRIDDYKDWEENFLRNQIKKPWQVAGQAYWVNGEFKVDLKDIEKM